MPPGWPATCLHPPHAVPGLPEPSRPPFALAARGAVLGQGALEGRHRPHHDAAPRRPVRGVLAHAADPLAACLRHRLGHGRRHASRCPRRENADCAFWNAVALPQGHPGRAPARAAGCTTVGPFRDAAARNRAHPVARPRRVPDRLAQRARRAAVAWRLQPRRLHAAAHPVPRSHRPWRAHGRGLPALRGCARRHRAHGRGRQPRHAAQPSR